MDAVDHLTENQGPIAPTRPRSVYFDVVVEAKKPGFDADSFRQGLQEALVQDPDLLALGRKQSGFNDHGKMLEPMSLIGTDDFGLLCLEPRRPSFRSRG